MNQSKYKAIDIANYIIWFVNKDDQPLGSLTPLKLQKILYYVSAAYLQKYDELLFEDKFQKWQYGPVVKDIYHEFKIIGFRHIDEPKSTWMDCGNTLKQKKFDEHIFKEDVSFTRLADPIIKDLIKIKAFDLVEMTHREEAWLAYESEIMAAVPDLVYTEDELRVAKIE